MKSVLTHLLLGTLIAASTWRACAQSWVVSPGTALPNDAIAAQYFPLGCTTNTGLAYGTNSASEVGDLYLPNPMPTNRVPAVILVHGGGGTSGSRLSTRETQQGQLLAAHGYVAFNIDYSVGKVWPKNIRDWRLAVRWLRAHADTYNVDTNHIGIIGGSFGGYAAGIMSGLTNGQMTLIPDSNASYNNISLDVYPGNPLNNYSGDVQAAFDLYGPMLFTGSAPFNDASGQYSSPTSATYYNASAAHFVHATSAPLFIAQGTSDTTVDITNSYLMTNVLAGAGATYQFARIIGAQHTFCIYDSTKGGTWPTNGTSGLIDLRKDMCNFFDRWLLVTNQAPSITLQPQATTGCAGSPASFTATTAGTAPLNYQWRFNGTNLVSATNSTYAFTISGAGDAGNYSVVVSNAYGAVTSSNALLTVNAATPPAITGQPTNLTVLAGASATFTVTATGTALQYLWSGPSGLIPGATNASLNITSAQNTNAGNYSVTVFNSCNAVVSSNVVLLVNAAPSIVAPPGPQVACTGESATFNVSAVGTAPLAYQWYDQAGAPILAATNDTVTVMNLVVGDSGNYFVVVTNAYGATTSSVAALTVSASATLGISSQPADTNAAVGDTVSFTVMPSGGGTYTYFWHAGDAEPIPRAVSVTNATLVITNVQPEDTAPYTCLVMNDCSELSSLAANLTVYSTTPSTNFTSSGAWVCPAGVTSVQVECWGGGGGGGGTTGTAGSNKRAGGGGAGGAYVKNVSVAVVPGTTYTVTVGSGGTAGGTTTSTCDAGAGGGSTFAGSGVTTILAVGGAGGVGGASANSGSGPGGVGATTGNAGFTAGFSYAGGNGAAGVTNSASGGGGGAGGATGVGGNASGLTPGAAASGGGAGGAGRNTNLAGQAGNVPGGGGGGGFAGGIGGGAGGAGQVTITYNLSSCSAPSANAPSASPSGTVCSGTSVLLTTNGVTGGSTPYTFQWFRNGTAIAGSNDVNLLVASPVNGDQYTYAVASSCGTAVTSSVVTLTVASPVVPSVGISASPGGVICNGTAVIFTATPTNGGVSPVYSWRINGMAALVTGSATYTNSQLANGDVVSVLFTPSADVCVSPTNATSGNLTMSVRSFGIGAATNTLLNENFTAQTGWTLGAWNVTATTPLSYAGASGGNYANAPITSGSVLLSPTVNGSGNTSLVLTFGTSRNTTYTGNLLVEGSTNGGTSWTTITNIANANLSTSGGTSQTNVLDVSYDNKTALVFRFSPSFTGTGGGSGGRLRVDDVKLTGLSGATATNAGLSANGSTTLCAGGSVTLTASAGGSAYLWSDGRTNSSITITTNGTFYVTITDAGGCQSTSPNTNVVVASLTAGNAVYARGRGISLKIPITNLLANASAAAGNVSLVSIGAVSTNGAFINTNATYVLVPAEVVADQFSYTVKGSLCPDTATGTVTVNLADLAGGQQGLVTTLSGTGPYAASMRFYGLLGTSYLVQRSTNLTFWTTLSTVTANASNGVINFIDTNAPAGGSFYRFKYP